MKTYQSFEKGQSFEDVLGNKEQKPVVELLTSKDVWGRIKDVPFQGYYFVNQINEFEALYKSIGGDFLILNLNRHINIDADGANWQRFLFNEVQIFKDYHIYKHIIKQYKKAKVWDWKKIGVIFDDRKNVHRRNIMEGKK